MSPGRLENRLEVCFPFQRVVVVNVIVVDDQGDDDFERFSIM